MVVYKAPQEIGDERRRKLKKVAQKKGRKPSKEILEMQDYTLFVTNVPSKIWRKEIVGTVYRARWRIELIFKEWKQLLRIDVMKGSRVERILCLIFGRLIMIIIAESIHGFCSCYAFAKLKREVSAFKLINWLRRSSRLTKSIFTGNLEQLLDDLLLDLPRSMLKQKRRRKTTDELLLNQVAYLDSFH